MPTLFLFLRKLVSEMCKYVIKKKLTNFLSFLRNVFLCAWRGGGKYLEPPPPAKTRMPMSSYLLGSQHNAVSAISPATTKMILKTVRDSKTSQDIHINAIYCSSKSIRFTFNSILKIIAIGFALFRLLSYIFLVCCFQMD